MLDTIDHGNVRELRLARPPANALNPELMETFIRALIEAPESAEAVVISGSPGMFTGGLDVPEFINYDYDQMIQVWLLFIKMLKTIALLPVPSAFALTGHAPAGGIVMALYGDYRIMPRGKYFTGTNEVQVGIALPPTIYKALERVVGVRIAEKIAVSGALLTAEQALEIGLVDELAADPEATVGRAIEWCQKILALPRLAMLSTRSLARTGLHELFEDSELHVERFVDIWFSDSAQAALKSLVDKLNKS